MGLVGRNVGSQLLLLFRELAREVGSAVARGLCLCNLQKMVVRYNNQSKQTKATHLDVQHLHLTGKLKNLVLDLSVLESIGGIATGSIDRGVELFSLGGLGSLPHAVHGIDDVVRNGAQIDISKWCHEDIIRLRLGIAGGAIADLELSIAKKADEVSGNSIITA